MAFTFNWASGPSVPVIKGGDRSYQDRVRTDAANYGSALRGYETRKANQEYADMLGGNASEIASIKAEIASLERRNAELESQRQAEMASAQQDAQQQSQVMAPQYTAQNQMQGYGAYMQGMQDQGYGSQAGPVLDMMMASYRRPR